MEFQITFQKNLSHPPDQIVGYTDDCKSLRNLWISVNILDAINWISESKKAISALTIVNCVQKGGLGERSCKAIDILDDLPEILRKVTTVEVREEESFEAREIESDLSVHEGVSESREADLTYNQLEDG